MTRISIALVAIFAFVVCACERQPVPGQTVVTHIHGSNGDPKLENEHAAGGELGQSAEKKEGATHATTEEKPTFFPEKK